MSVNALLSKINSGFFDEQFELLYNSSKTAKDRYAFATKEFEKLFGDTENLKLFSAPGRSEVGGNHTDHQHGSVLACSVNLDVIAVVAPTDDNIISIKSEGFEMDTISLDDLEPKASETGKAISLIRGMCGLLKKDGFSVGGFNAYTTSNVLKGSGLSSSAAFEVLLGEILNSLYNNRKISAVEIAKYAQKAENIYFGKPCGLMDQMASSVGGFTGIDFADPDNPIIEKVNFEFNKCNHALCIVNTGGNHADLTNDYADITKEMKQIAGYFNKNYLIEVNEENFYSQIGNLKNKFPDRAVLRAIHFFDDNRRAKEEKIALQNNNFEEFLKILNLSGNSSFKYLQNVFSPSAPAEQGLSLALALTERFLKGRGGCRVHGGGFAGTIQAFIPTDILDEYIKMIEEVFGKGSCYVLNVRSVGGYSFNM